MIIYNSLTNDTPGRLDLTEVLPVLGGLMLVLIGIELLHTVKIYFEQRQLHVEVVVLVRGVEEEVIEVVVVVERRR